MTPLSDDEKREIVRRFNALHQAITKGAGNVAELRLRFRDVYRGDLLPYIEDFGKATDKKQWAGQLRIYLADEIEGRFWTHPHATLSLNAIERAVLLEAEKRGIETGGHVPIEIAGHTNASLGPVIEKLRRLGLVHGERLAGLGPQDAAWHIGPLTTAGADWLTAHRATEGHHG